MKNFNLVMEQKKDKRFHSSNKIFNANNKPVDITINGVLVKDITEGTMLYFEFKELENSNGDDNALNNKLKKIQVDQFKINQNLTFNKNQLQDLISSNDIIEEEQISDYENDLKNTVDFVDIAKFLDGDFDKLTITDKILEDENDGDEVFTIFKSDINDSI